MEIAVLEREADEARFDWLELRDSPNAVELWRAFTLKAADLDDALSRLRRTAT
jgi:hypothetical protein